MAKKCNICLQEKEYKEFYSNKGCADGYQNRCIECTKQKSKERLELINSDPVLKEKEQQRHRQKYHRLAYKEKHKPTADMKKKAMATYNSAYPEKKLAKSFSQHVQKMVETNEIHHWSYNEPHYKSVIELTTKEHAKAHRFIKYDQERFMYRRIDTMELLDTKEKHLEYIMDCIKNKPD